MTETDIPRLLFEQAPEAIVFADRDGLIRHWNAAAATIFGFSESDALGQSLDLIVPERFRDAHWTGYQRALAEGRTKYSGQALPTRSVRKDGSTIYVELMFAIVHDDAGSVIGALAHARDITERFAQERAQRQRLQELEQKVSDLDRTGA